MSDRGLWIVLAVAIVARLGFAFAPPPFLTPDSQGYYLPGWELAHGLGFGPELRRTPLYSLFIALNVLLLGDDLRGLVLAQHALGVATTGLTYALGRVAFGRLAGLLAGLGVALSGPLLVYEHAILTEPLFTCLLTLTLLLMLLALRRPTAGWMLAAGLALAAATLTRPVAYVLLPLLPLALLVQRAGSSLAGAGQAPLVAEPAGPPATTLPQESMGGPGPTPTHGGPSAQRAGPESWRRTVILTAWYGVGVAALLLPWMARNAAAHGTFSAEGALGQALIGRTVRHDRSSAFYSCPPSAGGDTRTGALRIICEEAATGEPSGGTVSQRVRDELQLSQAQTSNLLRQVALEAILTHPTYYLTGSIRMAAEILAGKRETVIAPWRERTTRNWDNKWDPRLVPLVKNPPQPEGPEYARADAIVSFFQPFRWRRELALLLGLGLLGACLRPSWRPALLLPLAAGGIVLASAALDGNVWRYRYPVDPLLATLAAGGLQGVGVLIEWVGRRKSGARRWTGATGVGPRRLRWTPGRREAAGVASAPVGIATDLRGAVSTAPRSVSAPDEGGEARRSERGPIAEHGA